MNKTTQVTENNYTEIKPDIVDDFYHNNSDEFEWDNSDDSYFDFADVIRDQAGEKDHGKNKNSTNRRDDGSELPDPVYDDYKIYTPDDEDEKDVN